VTTAVVQANHAVDQAGRFTDDQVALIKRTIAPKVTDDELALFLQVCNKTGLDPFARQIYAVVRDTWNPDTRSKEPKMSIQTGIDGFRLIAERSGRYVGSEEEWGPARQDGKPEWARVTVYKLVDGTAYPFRAVAHWDEYAQESGNQWKKMPRLMLAKCAESLALRKAFPQELSGLYTTDEMGQADNSVTPTHAGDPVFERAETQAAQDLEVAPAEVQSDLRTRLGKLPPEIQTSIMNVWKQKRLGSLKLSRLRLTDVDAATELVVQGEEMAKAEAADDPERPFTDDDEPVDAEVVG
jgi:phage recombination protein Bet